MSRPIAGENLLRKHEPKLLFSRFRCNIHMRSATSSFFFWHPHQTVVCACAAIRGALLQLPLHPQRCYKIINYNMYVQILTSSLLTTSHQRHFETCIHCILIRAVAGKSGPPSAFVPCHLNHKQFSFRVFSPTNFHNYPKNTTGFAPEILLDSDAVETVQWFGS